MSPENGATPTDYIAALGPWHSALNDSSSISALAAKLLSSSQKLEVYRIGLDYGI